MSPPIYPVATRDSMPLLAQLLAEWGVELRVAGDGKLKFRDCDKCLSEADRAMVRHYAEPLAAWLQSAGNRNLSEHLKETEPVPPDGPHCDRCRSSDYRDVPIHTGQSTRRECARCGRTWGFPVWYGKADPGGRASF